MRQVIFGGANSFDGYLARSNDAVDWLIWSDEVADVMAASATTQLILFGTSKSSLARTSVSWVAATVLKRTIRRPTSRRSR